MRKDVQELSERFEDFAVEVIQIAESLPRTLAGRHIGDQFLRSGTSVASNYEEACAAESRADFIHKLRVALKEAREVRFWLRVGLRAQVMPAAATPVLAEAEALCNILAQSIITTRAGTPSKRQPATPGSKQAT